MSPLSDSGIGRSLALLTRALASISAFIALTALVAWGADVWRALTFGAEYVPMAPVTATLLLLFSASLLLDPRTDAPAPGSGVATAMVWLVCIGAGISLASFALDMVNPLERWQTTVPDLGGVAVGRISVYTAGLLFLLSIGRLVHGPGLIRMRTGVLSALVTFALTLLILQAYLLGSPLFYGTGTIPVAVLTALGIHLLSAATIVRYGAECWPLRVLLDTERSGPPSVRGFRALAMVLSLFTLLSGALWYRGARDRADAQAQQQLLSVANGLANRIGDWHAMQLLDAHAIAHLAPWGRDPLAAADASRWLRDVRAAFEYESVALFTAAGELRAVEPERARPDAEGARAKVAMLRADSATGLVEEGVTVDDDGRPFTLWLPLRRADDTTAVGWLRLRADARAILTPLVRGLPMRERTAEAVVYARDGTVAMPLHDVLKRPDGPRTIRVRLDSSDAPVALGWRQGAGVYRAVDYAGTPVTSAVVGIPGTSWLVTTKVDRAELAVPVRWLALRASIVSLLLALSLAALIYALWYRRDLASAGRELSLLQQRDASLAELSRSEARYSRALDGTTDGVWEWDLGTDEFYLSPKWRDGFGARQDSVLNSNDFFSRVHPADLDAVRAAVDAHLTAAEPLDREFRLRDDADRYHWVWARGEAQRDGAGKPTRITGSVSDVTERRESEQTLRRLDRVLRLRSAANQALVRAASEDELLKAVCDIAVHEGGYRMAWVGYAQQDEARTVRPMAWSGDERGYLRENVMTWAEEPRGLGPAGRSIRTGRPQAVQDIPADAGFGPWRQAAADRGFAACCAIPLTSEAVPMGAIMLYSAERFAFDDEEVALLTELGNDLSFGIKAMRDHHAVAAQQAELRLFREVMERSSDAIFLMDAATGHFIDFNEAACRELGYTPDELRQLGPSDVVPRLQGPQSIQQVDREIAQGQTPIRLSEHRRKDGTTFPVEVSRTVLEVGGRRLILAVARNLTDRMKAEAERSALEHQLLRSQRMESVGRLAGGVAHDFNNLLTVINANADIVAAELPPGSPIAADVLQIRAAGARAAALTRQLLAFSRQSVMKREPLELSELARNFVGLLRRVIGEDIVLDTRFADQPCPVFADPGQLEQVLMNLCVNARDAMPKGGTLTIETRRLDIDAAFAARHETMQPGPHVLIRISDTGTGMSKEVQANIFEPFFTTKDPGKGTGLGLATVYGIVKQTGGSIWVESQEGRGTTFSVYLPVHHAEALPVATPAPTPATTGHETILVVEDDTTIRQVARRILEKGGYTVHTTANASEALDFLELYHTKVQLMLTDLVMPGMSGIELAREVRLRFPGIIVLLTSGYSAEALAAKVESEPDLPIISKPYAVTDLLAKVRGLLDRVP